MPLLVNPTKIAGRQSSAGGNDEISLFKYFLVLQYLNWFGFTANNATHKIHSFFCS